MVVECASWTAQRVLLEDLDVKYPAEMVAVQATCNARVALECGYTAARSAGCLFNTDVWLASRIRSTGYIIGWEHTFVHQLHDLLHDIHDGRDPSPSFADGLAVQCALDAVARSAARGERVAIDAPSG